MRAGARRVPLALAAALAAGVSTARTAPARGAELATPQAAPEVRDTLVLDAAEAVRMGLAARPDLRAARAAVEAAEGRLREAGTYPYNPTLEAKATDLVSPGSTGPLEVVLSQEIEWAGQGGLRSEMAGRELEAARADLADRERLAGRAILDAFHRAAAAEERLATRRRAAALAVRLRDAVELQLSEGQVSLLERNLARVSSGLARAAELTALRARDTATVALARELGLVPGRPVRAESAASPPPAPPGLEGTGAPTAPGDLETLTDRALASRGDLAAAAARVAAAHGRRRLLAREALPNVVVGGVAERGSAREEVRWGVRAAIPLPLWNRNQGPRDAAAGEARRLEAERDAVELEIRGEVRAAVEAWSAARRELEVLDGVADAARESEALLETAYVEGQMDLPTMLALLAQLLDAELARTDAWVAERAAATALVAATGGGHVAPDPADDAP